MELRSGFNYDRDEASLESGLFCQDKSLTLQSQAQDADINLIVKRFGVTGMLPNIERLPIEADFVDIFDYRSAVDAVREAERLFMEVPADIRKRFNHDPGEFVRFCSDPANLPELRKLGLAKPEEPAKPVAEPAKPAT